MERITVSLPQDGMLFWKLEGEEALSQAFTFTVTLLSHNPGIESHALLGQPITVAIPCRGLLATRYLNGKITAVKVQHEPLPDTRYTLYQLTMEPDLWPMKCDSNLRIFQHQTVPQMIKTLLQENRVTVEDQLTAHYRQWEYCVQYQESSFSFISRLMELEGIYYFFRHQQDRHVMVLMDRAERHQPFSGYETIPWYATPSGSVTDDEGVSHWTFAEKVTPGICSLDDYDFRKPHAWMLQARQNPRSPRPGEIDVYDWPGRFVEPQQGEHYACIRQQIWQASHQHMHGQGTALGIAPGYIFSLQQAPWLNDSDTFLTIRAHYLLEEKDYASSGEGRAQQCIVFSVIPSATPFRAPVVTPWPKTCGPQTARVVGPPGESIWTDKYGRIKVKFHWDRQGKGDESSSCWVRVSSAWAGQGFGGVQIPRVNDEVVIDFINGDPDRPLVTGRVYNAACMPPWTLPAAATQMGFLSRSKDGSPDNANALRFEDKAGAEQVWLQAERNMDVHIKRDARQYTGNNDVRFVGASAERRVVADHLQAVKGETVLLTGKSKRDAVVDRYVLAAGTVLRFECGDSALELTAEGQINLTGKGFNLFVEGNGAITTRGGVLVLNDEESQPVTAAPGGGHRGEIVQAVAGEFIEDNKSVDEKTKIPKSLLSGKESNPTILDERVVRSIMKSEGKKGEQGKRKELFGFRQGNGKTYDDILSAREKYGEGSEEEFAVISDAMNDNAKKAGALNYSDPGKQAAIMSMAHMRGIGGAQAILNSMRNGTLTKSGTISQGTINYIDSMTPEKFQKDLVSARLNYDKKIYGNTITMKDGVSYNWWEHYGKGLEKRYERESLEFLSFSSQERGTD